jgi:DNA polymerase I
MSNNSTLKSGDHLYLIDGSGYIFRAYHALPPLTRKSDGLPVGAVQGFCNMLWKLLEEKSGAKKATHLAVIFDHSGKTFRNDFYPEYKAHRPEAPADLRPQFGLIRQATRAFNVACVEMENFEADDLIATYTRQAVEAGATVRIVTSDKDLMQLVKPGVMLLDTMKDKEISDAEVLEKFGVTPDKVIEVQALAGDSVDNVPGVPGIGLKTGAELINLYGTLETLLERAPEIKQNKRRENLIAFAEQARISKRLVTLDQHVAITQDLSSFAVDTPRASELIGFLKALEFTSFTRKIAAALDANSDVIDAVPVTFLHWPPEGGVPTPQAPSFRRRPEPILETNGETSMGSGLRRNDESKEEDNETQLKSIPINHADYETVTTLSELEKWIAVATAQSFVCIDTETDSLDAMQANIVGVSLATAPGKACYIPLAHQGAGDGLFSAGLIAGQISRDAALQKLKPLFENPSVLKIGQNLKYVTALQL